MTSPAVELLPDSASLDRSVRPEQCVLHVQYLGTITPDARAAINAAMQARAVGHLLHRDLRAVAVTVNGAELIVTAIGSEHAIESWADGRLLAALQQAVQSANDSYYGPDARQA